MNPPLTRLPKKSKLYGWQCSECDKTSDSEVEEVKTPRRSRSIYSRDKSSDQLEVFSPKVKIKPLDPAPTLSTDELNNSSVYEDESVKVETSTFDESLENNTTLETSTMDIQLESTENHHELTAENAEMMVISTRPGKKRRRDKHKNRYSPDIGSPTKEHKRKRKKKSFDMENPNTPHPRITIKVRFYFTIY